VEVAESQALSPPSIGASGSLCGASSDWCGSAAGLGQNFGRCLRHSHPPLASVSFIAIPPHISSLRLSLPSCVFEARASFLPPLMVFARVANLFSPGIPSNLVDDGRGGTQHTMESLESLPVNRTEAVVHEVEDVEAVRPPYLHVGQSGSDPPNERQLTECRRC
jgi:hypothetical protein